MICYSNKKKSRFFKNICQFFLFLVVYDIELSSFIK